MPKDKIRRMKDRCGHRIFLEPYGKKPTTKGHMIFLYAIVCRDVEDDKEDIVLDRRGVKKLIRKLTKMLKAAP